VSYSPQETCAELERVRAELADVREDLGFVEVERDELRAAISEHRSAIYAPHRTGNDADRALWKALDR
jgi:hypothetical protein